jgi:hypothetical protein
MTISTLELALPRARLVTFSDTALIVELSDGRTISAPLAWYPRLLNAKPVERECWRLLGEGEGVNWPDLDEDVSVEGLIAGRPSAESAQSLRKWLDSRT